MIFPAMKERILEFLKSENKTSALLAEEIGVQPSGISHILSGRNNPSLDFVIRMLEKYPFLSAEWLLFGKGKMYRENSMPELFEDTDLLPDKAKTIEKAGEITNDVAEKKGNSVSTDMKKRSGVEKIVWFYNDNKFREFLPDNDK